MNKKIIVVYGLTLLIVPLIITNVSAIDTVPLPDSPHSLVAIGTWPTPEETLNSNNAVIESENPVINPGSLAENDCYNIRNNVYDLNSQVFMRNINPWIQ
jgi:hypothetical protein